MIEKKRWLEKRPRKEVSIISNGKIKKVLGVISLHRQVEVRRASLLRMLRGIQFEHSKCKTKNVFPSKK